MTTLRSENTELVKRIEKQQVTIAVLVFGLFVLAGFAVLQSRREHAASLNAGTYWQDLFQEREDRKRDLDYIRSLEARIAAYEARKQNHRQDRKN